MDSNASKTVTVHLALVLTISALLAMMTLQVNTVQVIPALRTLTVRQISVTTTFVFLVLTQWMDISVITMLVPWTHHVSSILALTRPVEVVHQWTMVSTVMGLCAQ
jgi:hypothetical protein